MRFNIDNYPGNHVMHCKTLIEALSFTAHLSSIGKTWNGGSSYLRNCRWNDNEEDTCYEFNEGRYSNLNFFKDNNWTILEWSDFMYDTPAGKIDENNDYDKTLITIAYMDFFRLPEENGLIPIVARDPIGNYRFDDVARNCTSNFAKSTLLQWLTTEILPRIEAALGEDNVVYFETDLTTVCGDKAYGTINTKISMPTLRLYQDNFELFKKYSNTYYWWLATPWNTNSYVCMIMDNDGLGYEMSRYTYGVRPLLYVKASALTVQN